MIAKILIRCCQCLILIPVLLSLIMETDLQQVYLFGEPFGGPCRFKVKHGVECGSCGLTRAWVLTSHFNVVDARALNIHGPTTFFAYVFWSVSTFFLLEQYIQKGRQIISYIVVIFILGLVTFWFGFYPVYSINADLLKEYEGFDLKPEFCSN